VARLHSQGAPVGQYGVSQICSLKRRIAKVYIEISVYNALFLNDLSEKALRPPEMLQALILQRCV
jgi:hypothetical protein